MNFKFALVVFALFACSAKPTANRDTTLANPNMSTSTDNLAAATETATFAGGCFWCTEAVFQRLEGVQKVVSGYSGGTIKNPSYKEICTGRTGHAEVIQITFDPAVISFDQLLDVFFKTHDPTTLNRQGNDVGTQYRSAVFYHSEAQKTAAEKAIARAQTYWPDPIVTEVTAFKNFYPAEDYHQNYFNNNSGQPYCSYVIRPKLNKFEKEFNEMLKDGEQKQ